MGIINFVQEIWEHPRELSTIFPSSPFLAKEIASHIDFSEDAAIAELGAGDGALTDPLVEKMTPNSKLFLIEIVDSFCDELEETYSDHAKSDAIEVLNRSADELDLIAEEFDIDGYDYIVSGLPLTTLPDDLSSNVLDVVYQTLKPDGRYIQFQYSLDYRENIEERFGPVQVEKVWLNILPANVYVAEKNSEEE